MKTIYINANHNRDKETIDEFRYDTLKNRKYAKDMLKEYRLTGQNCWLSQRHCKNWK